MKPQQKAKEKPNYSVLQNVLWMISIAWRTRKRTLLYTVLIAVLEVLRNVTQLYVSPQILQRVEQHSPMGELLGTIAFFTLALFLLTGLKEYITTISIFPRIDVRMTLTGEIGKKSNTTSFVNTLNKDFIRLGEKAMNATNGNYSAGEVIWITLSELLQNAGGFIVYLTILSRVNLWMLVVILLTCTAGFFVSRYANDRIYQNREESEKLYAQKTYIRRQSESITMAKDIRIFGLQNWLNDLFDSVHDAYLHWRLGGEKLYLLADLTEVILTIARNGIAYVFLIRMALTENLSVAEFLLYFTAVTTFTQWVMGILQKSAELHKHSLDLCGLRDYLNWPEPYRFEGGKPIPAADSYELKLENVSFRYPDAEKDTIRNLNLTVHPGEKLAIVGLNGAGKTTVVKLLCGLLDPTGGRVLLNGTDIRDFNRAEYYKLFGAVFQDFSVMEATVAENVAQTQEGIDLNRVRDCIEKAGLTEMVDKLPEGLNTHVGREVWLDGVLFSGGQTQRLMLARALYKDAPILLLDEPTAALDPIAENDIYLKYDSMTSGKLSLFISHRLASTRFCDRILYVDDGGIAEEGTHDSLLKKGGKYAELYDIQSRYYQEGREF